MNTLIDPLKQIARDLVEKKLWPVAALLLAAVVAVPVLLGGSSAEPVPAPPAAVVAGGPDASKSLVTVVDQPVTGEDDRPGPVDDPFYDPPEPAEPANVDGGAAAPAADAAKGGAAAGAGGGAGAGGTPAQTPEAPAEEIDPSVYYSTVVRWWEKDPSKAGPIRRLTPFGGLADPAALYLGVTKSNGNYAVFLLGPNATSDGEAKCEDAECRVFGLKSGRTQIVTVTPPDGGEARQYNLDVVSVKARAADADTLRKMRIRVHADGRDVMREMWNDARTAAALRPVQYDRTAGLLVKSATAATAAAAAASE